MKEKDLDIPAPSPVPNPSNLTDIEKKDLLIKNYLPNISKHREVIISVNDKPFPLNPNLSFTNQKDYYIFYNNNLKVLIDLHKEILKQYLKEHNVVLYYKKNNLTKCLKNLGFDISPDEDNGPFKALSGFIARKWYQNVIDDADLIANNLNTLISIVNKFSEEITPEKMCAIEVSKNIFDEKIKFDEYLKNSENNICLKFFSQIEEIKNRNIDDIERLRLMNDLINKSKKEIDPYSSDRKKKDFCIILNNINNYESRFEESLETKKYALLKVMDILRRNLDFKLLEFTYKFIENKSPILNIKIDKYKLICNTNEEISIYLEKGEAKKFMKNLEEELDKKAKNVDTNYQFQDIGLKEIIKIAKEINFENFNDLLQSLDDKIMNYQSEYNSKKFKLISYAVKDVINFSIDALNGLNLKINGKIIKIASQQITNFLESDKSPKEKQEGKNENLENKESSDKKETNETKNDELTETRRKNLNKIGIEAKEMSAEIIENISKSFYLYQDMEKITYNIKNISKMKKILSEKNKYNLDFYNILKLYCYLEKKEIEKNDYVGIILEEKNKDKTEELREYSIKKLTVSQED